MKAATPEQMLDVVKWWARARGFLHGHGALSADAAWWLQVGSHDKLFVQRPTGEHSQYTTHWTPSPAIALAWALLVESDAALVWAGKCKTCGGKKGTAVQGLSAFVAQMVDGGWATPQRADGSRDGWLPCSDCEKTGETITPAAVLLLDTVESVTAREYLAAHADKLLAAGNPLGELLVWALNLWMPKLCVSHCDGVTSDSIDLRHAHTGEAVRWLEWLTWSNWFAEQQRLRRIRQHDDRRDAFAFPAPGTTRAYERAAMSLAPRVTSAHVTTGQIPYTVRLTYIGIAAPAEVEAAIEPVRSAATLVQVVRNVDDGWTHELRGDGYDFAIMDELMQCKPAARVYADSLFAEPTFGEVGDTYSIQVGGHTYSMRLSAAVTASAIATVFNQQGGPATFAANDHGLTLEYRDDAAIHDTSAHLTLQAFDVEPPTPTAARRQHAEHIGSRLGRRLGVRR